MTKKKTPTTTRRQPKRAPKAITNAFVGRRVIVRTQSAGVFAGRLIARSGQEVALADARRLWYWSGAASLSQLSIDGVGNPSACKFPAPVARVELLQAIEILPLTPKAEASIAAVPPWLA